MPASRRRPYRQRSPLDRWEDRISLVYFTLIAGFAVAIVFGALFNLPANPPDHWWVANTARSMVLAAAPPTLMCLVLLAVYLLGPEIRRFADRFRSMRLARLSIAILLPSCTVVLIYSVALMQDPALWNRFIFVLPLVPIAPSTIMLVIALVVGYIERKQLLPD